MIKWFIRFFKIVPLGVSSFSNDPKVKESIYQDGLTTNNDHQSFRNPRYSKFGNIFSFLFFIFYSKQNTILFRDRNRIRNHFFVFFSEIQNTFFVVLTKVRFSNPNDVMKFINTKTKNPFFFNFLSLQKNPQHVYLLYYQPAKRNIRTDVSLHVS